MKKAYYSLFFAWMILAALLAGCGGDDAEQSSPAEAGTGQETADSPAPEDGDASPQIVFEGQDIEGNAVSSAIFSESKLTMVNVWATYCNPCLSEMPSFGELAGEYDPEEFRIIGIVSNALEGGDKETIDLAAELIEKTGADYTHLLLNESIYAALLTGVTQIPTTFFVDQNGTVLGVVTGAYEKSVWEDTIHALLENL